MRRPVRLALLLALLAGPAAAAPQRVVSINLCTDQLALLVAAPGQLVSVSRLAADPASSNLAEAAARLPLNGGTAEEIYLLDPDLVLASTFTRRPTIDMLRRLGIRVELFPPAESLSDIPASLRRLGDLLDRRDAAERQAADFEARLETLAEEAGSLPRARAAFYFANSYTDGAATLSDEILDRAGFDNAAREAGVTGSARLPLETLVMERPFVVRSDRPGGAAPMPSQAAIDHPALRATAAETGEAVLEQRWQVCGTPHVADAIAALIAARRARD